MDPKPQNDAANLTLDQMQAALSEASTRLDRAERAVVDARAKYDRSVNGNPHSDIETFRVELDKLYRPAVDAAEADAAKLARIARTNAESIAAATGQAPAFLSAADMVSAAAQRPFIADRCGDLPLGALVDAVRNAISSGDRAAMFAYSEYAAGRAKTVAAYGRLDPDTAMKSELRGLLGVVADRLKDVRYAPVHEAAYEILDRVQTVEKLTGERRRNDRQRTFSFQSVSDVPRE